MAGTASSEHTAVVGSLHTVPPCISLSWKSLPPIGSLATSLSNKYSTVISFTDRQWTPRPERGLRPFRTRGGPAECGPLVQCTRVGQSLECQTTLPQDPPPIRTDLGIPGELFEIIEVVFADTAPATIEPPTTIKPAAISGVPTNATAHLP